MAKLIAIIEKRGTLARESLCAAFKNYPVGSFLNRQANFIIKALPPVQAVSLGGDALS